MEPTYPTQQGEALRQPIGTAEIRVLVITAADLLSHERPTWTITEGGRMILARDLTEGAYPQHEALLTAMPVIDRDLTRGEYALRLRKVAEELATPADQPVPAQVGRVAAILRTARADWLAIQGARR
ncbi:hypothetical protein [Streptomyces albidoflavus]|uniref:hypothetical protein n=1 Tax=Streptomyces albidoflavus TaxID=1886 RepID=UPI001020F771|nr:hypothetical protein [Streptomyces albidoflavus]RZF06009.1 hypothetical protein C0R05_24565 [Streptomyces albidoflavus]